MSKTDQSKTEFVDHFPLPGGSPERRHLQNMEGGNNLENDLGDAAVAARPMSTSQASQYSDDFETDNGSSSSIELKARAMKGANVKGKTNFKNVDAKKDVDRMLPPVKTATGTDFMFKVKQKSNPPRSQSASTKKSGDQPTKINLQSDKLKKNLKNISGI